MPVLLHLLPQALALPALPDHPALLPATDAGFDGDQAYVATELPPHAQPAGDPQLAARGALEALAALHGAGLVHGGVAPAQLWSMDGEVRLAGAGLPWRAQGGSPQADLSDLAAALDALGGLPAPLRPLRDEPGQLSAPAALARLTGTQHSSGEASLAQFTSFMPTSSLPGAPIIPEQPAHDGSPIVLGEVLLGEVPETAGVQEASDPATPRPDSPAPPQTVVIQAAPAQPPASAPAAPEPASSHSPQERRRRENEARRAQAILDAQAGARRKAERLEQAGAAPAVPAPIRIGFADAAEAAPDDLPAWSATPGAVPEAAPRLNLRSVERLPASLRRAPEPPPPAQAEPAQPAAAPGRLPARRVAHEPIRIGWDEDDSWRVVRESEASLTPRGLNLPRWRWLPALLAALALLGLGLWAVRSQGAPPATPAAPARAAATATPCCDVRFTLQGAQAEVVVLTAPEDANLTPGQTLGRAPGVIRFPLRGRYRLRVVADGYSPAVLNLSVPRARPVEIALGP